MISFENDYTTGAHPQVLKMLLETNLEAVSGYGSDSYCSSAREKISKACECPEADVYFLIGGTQTNAVVISTLLKSYEGVITAATGHINIHEAGAIEYTGHKVLELPHHNGKIASNELEEYLQRFYADETHEHMVFPGMVYLSHPTEYGTLYAKEELESISAICKKYQILLFLDGARLGYGLASLSTDVTLPDLAKICDVFYIGGTKVGALFGEAVVFTKKNAPSYFITMVKQHGALLAKGRLLGVQFDALFTEELYWKIGRHAIDMAEQLKGMLKEKGYLMPWDSPTNQQYIVLENDQMEKMKSKVKFSFWEKYDETHTIVRFVTSWSTTQDDIDQLKKIL
ncbi:hypothetical protein C819_00627 [Lachnospiraceae bacterium 10-1]|nr:hypothetical protein C819_00627 [Lachnospiraceae bacterium 10-1]